MVDEELHADKVTKILSTDGCQLNVVRVCLDAACCNKAQRARARTHSHACSGMSLAHSLSVLCTVCAHMRS